MGPGRGLFSARAGVHNGSHLWLKAHHLMARQACSTDGQATWLWADEDRCRGGGGLLQVSMQGCGWGGQTAVHHAGEVRGDIKIPHSRMTKTCW